MTRHVTFARWAGLVCVVTVAGNCPSPASPEAHVEADQPAQIALSAFPPDCAVELDSSPVGRTSAQGGLELAGVEPGDHYVHVVCAGQAQQAFFLSPRGGETAKLRPQPPSAVLTAVDVAESRRELRRLVQTAAEARNAGNAEESISDLRRATQLDPENADLHRELGITFLLLRDWARARVEYLEAIKHDPTEAESHNGLGYALEKLGDVQGALNEFRLAMRLEPDDTSYREHYLEALAEMEAQQARTRKKR